MKLTVIYLITGFVMTSCGINSTTSESPMSVDKETYQRDKQIICDIYANNIEYYRLHHLYNIDTIDYIQHYKVYPYAQDDPANFYNPYGCRLTKTEHKFISSPYPTNTQLNIEVDTIIYDTTGNFFIAFICIEKQFKEIPQLCDIKHSFDGRAMIGYRDMENQTLKTYPLTNFIAISMAHKKEALLSVKRFYMKKLKGTYLSGSVYGDNKFGENVGDSSFFNESQFFNKTNSNHYLFQMYRDLGELKQYQYPYGN